MTARTVIVARMVHDCLELCRWLLPAKMIGKPRIGPDTQRCGALTAVSGKCTCIYGVPSERGGGMLVCYAKAWLQTVVREGRKTFVRGMFGCFSALGCADGSCVQGGSACQTPGGICKGMAHSMQCLASAPEFSGISILKRRWHPCLLALNSLHNGLALEGKLITGSMRGA